MSSWRTAREEVLADKLHGFFDKLEPGDLVMSSVLANAEWAAVIAYSTPQFVDQGRRFRAVLTAGPGKVGTWNCSIEGNGDE